MVRSQTRPWWNVPLWQGFILLIATSATGISMILTIISGGPDGLNVAVGLVAAILFVAVAVMMIYSVIRSRRGS